MLTFINVFKELWLFAHKYHTFLRLVGSEGFISVPFAEKKNTEASAPPNLPFRKPKLSSLNVKSSH